MKVTINNKQYLATLTKTAEINDRIKPGDDYQCVVKSANASGVMDYFYDTDEFTVEVKRFYADDLDTGNALFSVVRAFCFKNQAMLVDSETLTEATGKTQFETLMDTYEGDEQVNVEKTKDYGYTITLFDEEEYIDNVEDFAIEEGKGLSK